MARADLASPFLQGLQLGASMMVNLREIRQREMKQKSDEALEVLKQEVELTKAQMDQQKAIAETALKFVADEKITAPQAKLELFNKSLLPFLNSLLPAEQQVQPLTEWNDKASQLTKAMQAVVNLPEEVPQDVRMQALAEQLAFFGLGEEALKTQQKALEPLSAEQQELATLTPDEIRKRALKGTEPPAPEIRTGVKIDDKGTEAAIERDPATGAWKIITVGGKEVKGRSPKGEGDGKISESERKAAVLATRLQDSLNVLDSLPDAAGKPGAFERMFQTAGAESLANFFRSANRQQANAAQLDALDAALTLATGAAYTKEQIQNLSTAYFPQLNDSPQAAADKNRRFSTIVEAAKLAAGKAAPFVEQITGTPQETDLDALYQQFTRP